LAETEHSRGGILANMASREISHVVSADQDLMRLKALAVAVFPTAVPGNACASRLIKAGAITVGSEVVDQARKVREGEQVALRLEGPPVPVLVHTDETSLQRHVAHMRKGGFRVLREDAMHAVVFKPAGFHTCGRHWKDMDKGLPTILQPSTEDDAVVPTPLHRLDARVCGVLLVSKTRRATAVLAKQFEARSVRKRYRALLAGKLDVYVLRRMAEATADAGAGGMGASAAPSSLSAAAVGAGDAGVVACSASAPSPAAQRPLPLSTLRAAGCRVLRLAGDEGGEASHRFLIECAVAGKPSTTEVRVVSHTATRKWALGSITTVDLWPHSGRKHQLRAHMALLGFSILGDDLYPDGEAALRYMQQSQPPQEQGRKQDESGTRGEGPEQPCTKKRRLHEKTDDKNAAAEATKDAAPCSQAKPWVLRKHGLFLQACEVSYSHPLRSGSGSGNQTCSVPEVPKFHAMRKACAEQISGCSSLNPAAAAAAAAAETADAAALLQTEKYALNLITG